MRTNKTLNQSKRSLTVFVLWETGFTGYRLKSRESPSNVPKSGLGKLKSLDKKTFIRHFNLSFALWYRQNTTILKNGQRYIETKMPNKKNLLKETVIQYQKELVYN